MTCRDALARFPDCSSVEPLARYTTWRIGGPCTILRPGTLERLLDVMAWIADTEVPWSMLGRGSNLLAPSRGWDGVVVHLTGTFRQRRFQGETLDAGAGAPLPNLAGAACSLGLGGLVFAVGIPGTLGGAVFMNAGAYGECLADRVREVHAVFPGGEQRTFTSRECGFAYRASVFQKNLGAVYRVVLDLTPGDRSLLRREAAEVLEKRRRSFPLTVPNAGSVFRRPPEGPPPGKLLEDCGLKGYTLGGARFSPVHANFIENHAGADSRDILALIRLGRQRVREQTGIRLEEEIRTLGEGR